MESFINFSNDANITKLPDKSYYDELFADVSLVSTYLELVILLVTIPATIIPAAIIIHIIRKTEELHTNYSLFLVNLLVGDILTTIRYCFAIILIIVYLLNTRAYISDIFYIIITIPRIVVQYSFVLLAIDRVIGVAFPYRYRNIMKPTVVYALIASVWIIAAVLLLLIRIILGPPYLVWQLGQFLTPSDTFGVFFLYVLPQIISAIMIVGTNVYLHRIIVQSKKKLEDNLKLSGKDDHKVTRLQRLIHNLQMQLESSLSVFVLGGVDCLLNILRNVIFALIISFFSASDIISLTVLIVLPMERLQIILHSITYGIYQTIVRNRLRKYYKRFTRIFPPCPSKVVTLR